MNSIRRVFLCSLSLAIALLGGCGAGDGAIAEPSPDETEFGEACIPDDVEGAPIVHPDRRIEDIIEYLTGERQTGDLDPVEETINDPNFGGVWGDFGSGIVVAVLDCSRVDANEIARMAGGPEYLHLIEVTHTFRQVDEFRSQLISEAASRGVDVAVYIDSTLTGRHITVATPDPSELGDDFGSAVPDHLFTITEGELPREE